MDRIKIEMIEGVCNSCGCDKQLHGVGTLTRIKGVRINCEEHIQLHEADTYEPVKVPPQDSVFGLDGTIPEISVLVGMAIKVYKVRPDPRWKNSDAIGVHVNQPTTWRFRIVNPNEKAFGWVPVAWPGTIVVFRADQQDLTPQQMEPLSHFSRYNVRVALQHAAGVGWSLWGQSVRDDDLREISKLLCRIQGGGEGRPDVGGCHPASLRSRQGFRGRFAGDWTYTGDLETMDTASQVVPSMVKGVCGGK